MRAGSLFMPTLREIPAEAEIISHQLMLRAGMIQKTASGIYTYLPLAWRVMKKIMRIIREEMDAIGGQELCMPAAQPAEYWQQSGRWDVYGAELWRLQDRHGRDFCLGPTHEEIITSIIKANVRSYKQLPLRPYQIQTKYRDERRPRYGLMRSREFIMKDMYSFDCDEAGLQVSYDFAYEAYEKIFSRVGLSFRAVIADSGAIGGSGSHEFMALADSGESEILYCDSCSYAASVEIASRPANHPSPHSDAKPLSMTETPDCPTIPSVAAYLGVSPTETVKNLCYVADGRLVLVLIRGDRQVNEIKLKNLLDCITLELASDERISAAGLIKGYIGPYDTKSAVRDMLIVGDEEVVLMSRQVAGANKKGFHYINMCYGRDYTASVVGDIRMVEEGEVCPYCSGRLKKARGIEVGQVFKLRDKYSLAMGAHFIDETNTETPFVMGCYGIGVGRTMAAVIEQNYDERGIIWPMAVAPFQAVIIPINDKDEEIAAKAESLYSIIKEEKIEVVLDDRKERPGVKFNDADLIGYPIRVTIGKGFKDSGLLEVKLRKETESVQMSTEDLIVFIKENC